MAADETTARTGGSLWDIIVEKRRSDDARSEAAGAPKPETHIVLMGMRGAGKTTLIGQFLGESEGDAAPRPTQALEYTFARKALGAQLTRVVAHMWELGGGLALAPLLETAVTASTLASTAVYIVLDLSQPASLPRFAVDALRVAKARVAACMAELRAQADGSAVAQALVSAAAAQYGAEHLDAKAVKPCAVPLVLVANKYDLFRNTATAQHQQLVAMLLRYLAHVNGASLLYCSARASSSMKKLKQIVNWHAFGARVSLTPALDASDALVVPVGQDSLAAIGRPPEVPLSAAASAAAARKFSSGDPAGDRILDALAVVAPMDDGEPAERAGAPRDTELDSMFAEPVLDALRADKSRELEALVRASASATRS